MDLLVLGARAACTQTSERNEWDSIKDAAAAAAGEERGEASGGLHTLT